ncbi:hypothetical protein L4D00_23300 [Photobacterium swingsii]|uniref:hypothetical protein n=1 Tax=Photobacterium swingsii TaxID=680026 RepID=UPI003D14DCDF
MKKNKSIFFLIIAVMSMVISGCNIDSEDDRNEVPAVTDSKVVSLELTPVNMSWTNDVSVGEAFSLIKGNTVKLNVVARYEDGRRIDVTNEAHIYSTDPNIALHRLNDNLLHAVRMGKTEVYASFMGERSNRFTVTVRDEALKRIEIFVGDNEVLLSGTHLLAGNSQQLVARGYYADGTNHELTELVTWHIKAPGNDLALTQSGLLTSAPDTEGGQYEVIASMSTTVNGVEQTVNSIPLGIFIEQATLESIQLMPKNPVNKGQSEFGLALGNSFKYKAIGTYTNGWTVDITDSVRPHILFTRGGSSSLLEVSEPGILTTKTQTSQRSNIFYVSKGNIDSNRLTINITSAVLAGFKVTPHSTSAYDPVQVIQNMKRQFIATGIYSDGTEVDMTNRVDWNLDYPMNRVVSLSRTGLVTGLMSGGHAVMRATLGDDVIGRDSFEPIVVYIQVVSPTLQSIAITDSDNNELVTLSLVSGHSVNVNVMGTYDDGSTRDITLDAIWSIASDTLSYIEPRGHLIRGFHVGTDVLKASFGQYSEDTRSYDFNVELPVEVTPVSAIR